MEEMATEMEEVVVFNDGYNRLPRKDMVGAFVSAMIFKYTRSKIGAYLGEVIGTGILGGMLCYPIASMMMGQKAALFTFVGPFLASTLCGTVIAAVIITALYKSKAVRLIEEYID